MSSDLQPRVRRPAVVWLAIVLAVAGLVLLLDRVAPDVGLLGRLREWWPFTLVVLGVVGLVNLLPTTAKRGPVVLIALGLGLYAMTSGDIPDRIDPFVLPILLIVTAFGLLFLQISGIRTTPQQMVNRLFLIGHSRHVTWEARPRTVLIMHAIAGGCVLTFEGAEDSGPVRLEINAGLAGIDVRVPRTWKVTVASRSPVRTCVTEPGTGEQPNLEVVVVRSLLSGIEVGRI